MDMECLKKKNFFIKSYHLKKLDKLCNLLYKYIMVEDTSDNKCTKGYKFKCFWEWFNDLISSNDSPYIRGVYGFY